MSYCFVPNFQWFPISLKLKVIMTYKGVCEHSQAHPITFLLWSPPLFLVYFALSPLASLLFLKQTRYFPSSGPLHWLYSSWNVPHLEICVFLLTSFKCFLKYLYFNEAYSDHWAKVQLIFHFTSILDNLYFDLLVSITFIT